MRAGMTSRLGRRLERASRARRVRAADRCLLRQLQTGHRSRTSTSNALQALANPIAGSRGSETWPQSIRVCSAIPFDAWLSPPDAVTVIDGQQRKPALSALGWVFVRDSNRTFGGGTASSEVLRRSLVKRGWITDDEHREMYALSRLTPGTNLLAYCTAVGWRTRGFRGAVVTWLAASVPCSLIAVGVTALFDRVSESKPLGLALLVAMTVAFILLGASAWHLAKPQLTATAARRSIGLAVIVLALVWIGATPLTVLLVAATIGTVWA